MATLWIHSFANAKETAFDAPFQTVQVTVTGAAASAAVLTTPTGQKNMMRVRLFADVDCHVSWDGADATTADLPMGADNPEYFGIESGTVISVIERA